MGRPEPVIWQEDGIRRVNMVLTKAGSGGLGDLGGGAGRALAANAFAMALLAAGPLTAFAAFTFERGSPPLKRCGRDAKYLHTQRVRFLLG